MSEKYAVPILALSGKSNTGKTTLVERIIAELTERGVRVMSAKGHQGVLEFDTPGKDSWRHQKAGAAVSVLATPSTWMAIHQTDERVSMGELADLAKRSGCDVLVVEGFKDAAVEQIEVTVANRDSIDVTGLVDRLIAEMPACEISGKRDDALEW